MPKGTTRNGSSVARLSLLLTVALAVPAWSQVQIGPHRGNRARRTAGQRAEGHRHRDLVGHRRVGGRDLERPRRLRGDAGQPRPLPGDGGDAGIPDRRRQRRYRPGRAVGARGRGAASWARSRRRRRSTAAAPLLDTESGTLGHQVTQHPARRPALERPQLLRAGAPDAGGGRSAGRSECRAASVPTSSTGTAISGVRGSQLTFQIDGVDVTDHHQGGSYIQTSVDALQEFKVQQSAYSAEFSQAGGMLNAATKSGSSEFHGGLFEFYAQRRPRRHGLLRQAEAGARPAPVRRDARRSAGERAGRSSS